MQYELKAITEPGRRLVALAEELAADFASRAGEHDRDGRYPFENIETLKASGYFTALIPVAYGGMGVESVHDVVVASSRLARGDASTTLGVNMHFVVLLALVRQWRLARHAGDGDPAERLAGAMEEIAANREVMSAVYSEPDQDFLCPRTRAERTESGWVINGRKIFATMSPAATLLSVGVSYTREDGSERIGFARVPQGTPGVTLHDDWDALGMRASGSGSISLVDVHVPASVLRDAFPAGQWSVEFIERFLASGLFHSSASLGIAEAAVEQSVAYVSGRRKGPSRRALAERPAMQLMTAENAMDLAAMRAVFDRAGTLIDGYFDAHIITPATLDEAHAVFKEVQAAKTFVHAAAIRVVDRALTMSGGGGFMNKHPLSRLYRDVRAGPFMHPLGDSLAREYIGQVALGLEPAAA